MADLDVPQSVAQLRHRRLGPGGCPALMMPCHFIIKLKTPGPTQVWWTSYLGKNEMTGGKGSLLRKSFGYIGL